MGEIGRMKNKRRERVDEKIQRCMPKEADPLLNCTQYLPSMLKQMYLSTVVVDAMAEILLMSWWSSRRSSYEEAQARARNLVCSDGPKGTSQTGIKSMV
jgi:hypothetical protein